MFLRLGSFEHVKRSFQKCVLEAKKAEQYLLTHPHMSVTELEPKRYLDIDLIIDPVTLINGSLFGAVETAGSVFVNGPGVSFLKDKRIEAPIVIVGRINKSVSAQEVSQQTENLMDQTLC